MIVTSLVVVLGLFLYFLPSFIGRGKRSSTSIFVLNLLAGWTGIGWVAALIWALVDDDLPFVIVQQPPPSILCSACGRYCPAGAQFCQNCGQPLAHTGVATTR